MNPKTHTTIMVLIAVAALSPLYAQNAQNNQNAPNSGLRIGLYQPQNPVQGMTTPPIQGMTTPPIMPLGGGIAAQQPVRPVGNNTANVLGPGEVIFVPAGTLVIENNIPGLTPGAFLTAPQAPGAPATPPAPSAPTGGRGSSTQIQRSTRTPNESAQDSKKSAEPTRLELGTPRDQVIEKYGNPIAFMMGMNGETLYFNNGVVVFVRDGVVATPGK